MAQQLTNLQGLCIQQYHALPFDIKLLENIDLDMFPPRRLHFLVHALINNTKIPSESSMIRSQKRNQKKSGADKADEVVGRPGRVQRPARPVRAMRRARPFFVPNKFGPKPRGRGRRGDRRGRGRMAPGINMGNAGLIPQLGIPSVATGVLPQPLGPPPTGANGLQLSIRNQDGTYTLVPLDPTLQSVPNLPGSLTLIANQSVPNGFSLPNLVDPSCLQPVSEKKQEVNLEAQKLKRPLPAELVRKLKKRELPKEVSKSFKAHAPEWISLKAYRDQVIAKIQVYRAEKKSKMMPQISDKLVEEAPLYFQKKKASQKRRRLEKHQLIKKNRKALVELFGDAVFKRGWPISRREIRLALGIEQEDTLKIENLSEFLQMAELKGEIEQVKIENNSSTESEKREEKPEPKKEETLVQKEVTE